MNTPLVSIVIPCGPGHERYVGEALASCQWQTFTSWEAIVVNDRPRRLGRYADPRVRVIETGGGRRAAGARNDGITAARGLFTLQLDADDYLLPSALSVLLTASAQHDRAYTYGHHYGTRPDGQPVADALGRPIVNGYGVRYDEWDYSQANLHAVSALVPTWCWRQVGGFDEAVPAWDDWSGFLRLRMAGFCGAEVKQPVFVYRIHLSQQHHADNAGGAALQEAVRVRYRGADGRITCMSCGCGGGAATAKQVAQAAFLGGHIPPLPKGDGSVRVLEYIGPGAGSQTFRVNGRSYRVGNNATTRYLSTSHTLNPDDIPDLLALSVFREVPPPPAYAAPPPPIQPEMEASVVVAQHTPGDEDALEVDASGIARPSRARSTRARQEQGAA